MSHTGDDPAASLQDLFASLRSSNSSSKTRSASNQSPAAASSSTIHNSHSYLDPPPASLYFKGNQSQHHTSMNPNTTSSSRGATPMASDQSGLDRTAQLLNLLKFNQNTTTPSPSPHSYAQPQMSAARPGLATQQSTPVSAATHTYHGRGPSASDLVASFMGKPTPTASHGREGAQAMPSAMKSPVETSGSSNPQDFLLQLLNRSQPDKVQSSTKSHAATLTGQFKNMDELSRDLADASISRDRLSRTVSPIRVFGTEESRENTPFEPRERQKVDPSKESLFTYVNPFEQLAASSPRNSKTKAGKSNPQKDLRTAVQPTINAENGKRKAKEDLPERAAAGKKLTTEASEILQSIESLAPSSHNNGRSRAEALIGIGAPTNDAETVTQALNDVGEQVSRQVEHALAEAEEESRVSKVKLENPEITIVEKQLQEAAIKVKKELETEDNNTTLETIMSASKAKEVKEVIDEAANGNVEGLHESVEKDETVQQAEGPAIPVYNFPLKPFVSIDLEQEELANLYLREGAIAEVARFKKDFDQIDRTLVTASHEFIAYALPKAGGVRVIRQEDGLDHKFFKENRDRIFNVAISTAPPGKAFQGLQSFIATAVSGSVFWAAISRNGEDIFDDEIKENLGLLFPPVPAQDENTSGGQLKTRAKKSSRHPEFFAIGRGKTIQIVFPMHAQGSIHVDSASIVNTENYFKERSLKINTGKAGKDFCFSEDDSVIASLDKAGKLRLWDVRDLTNESNIIASTLAPIEINVPLMTFSTASPSEKSWPTSVLFLDKARPFARAMALRYIIVGLKQNHTLQLWDLGLGKAVQELNFPHETEADAICSVCYHAPSGVIVVGHPTRNSIYFIHLSAPKYSLPNMSQAMFVKRLANKDSTLAKPESTAIMSGMREYRFSAKDQLRSIDILPSRDSDRASDNGEDPTLFELYAMHSKGVTCMSIKRRDLGWNQDSKVINPVDAEKAGYVKIRTLRDYHGPTISEPSSINEDAQNSAGPAYTTPKGKKHPAATPITRSRDSGHSTNNPAQIDLLELNGTPQGSNEPLAKRKKNRSTTATGDVAGAIPPPAPAPPPAPPASYSIAAKNAEVRTEQKASIPSKEPSLPTLPKATPVQDLLESQPATKTKRGHAPSEAPSLSISNEVIERELQKFERVVSTEFSKALNRELAGLYRQFDEDKRVWDASGAAKQDAILRLVSSTLTDNVDKALSRIINGSIQQLVLPSISNVVGTTLNNRIPEWLTQQLLLTLPAQLKLALPEAVSKAVQVPDVLRVISDQVSNKIAIQVDRQFAAVLHQNITPAFQNLAIQAAQNISVETERRVAEQLKVAEVKHQNDSAKIDQLTALVRGLSETVHSMAAAQSQFQSQILKLQQHEAQTRARESVSRPRQEHSRASSELRQPEFSPEQEELNMITASLEEGRFEDGTIQWLQSKQQAELFDNLFVKISPEYLRECQGLVILSVGAAVTVSFETNVVERLQWLSAVLSAIEFKDPDLSEVAPKIIEVLRQRLESRFMHLCELDNRDPMVKHFPPLTKRIREISAMLRGQ